jgi:hypothetical protein
MIVAHFGQDAYTAGTEPSIILARRLIRSVRPVTPTAFTSTKRFRGTIFPGIQLAIVAERAMGRFISALAGLSLVNKTVAAASRSVNTLEITGNLAASGRIATLIQTVSAGWQPVGLTPTQRPSIHGIASTRGSAAFGLAWVAIS